MAEAVLQDVETYASFRQNTVAQLITTRHIMDMCLALAWSTESRVAKRGGSRTSWTLRGCVRQLGRQNGQRGGGVGHDRDRVRDRDVDGDGDRDGDRD